MKKMLLKYLRWHIIKTLNRNDFSTAEINRVMNALNLTEAGLPKMQAPPPPPPRPAVIERSYIDKDGKEVLLAPHIPITDDDLERKGW